MDQTSKRPESKVRAPDLQRLALRPHHQPCAATRRSQHCDRPWRTTGCRARRCYCHPDIPREPQRHTIHPDPPFQPHHRPATISQLAPNPPPPLPPLTAPPPGPRRQHARRRWRRGGGGRRAWLRGFPAHQIRGFQNHRPQDAGVEQEEL